MSKKILVVDDETTAVDLVKMRLEASGDYEVLVAHDGQEALTKARAENPDLIILDVMLPKFEGYQVCRMLKFDAKYKKIPIIMLTARTQDSDQKTGYQTGADAYMTKPFDASALLAKIEELLNKKST